jgi:recombination protein RecR
VKEFPDHIQKVINYLVQLPGVGPKSAFRMISHLLHTPDDLLMDFGNSIHDLKLKIRFCNNCFNISEEDTCLICNDAKRDIYKILVVEDILDLIAFERVGEYKGLYHVLGGVISPLRGIGPSDIRFSELIDRVNKLDGEVELIIATNPNLEGEATAMYIKNEFSKNDKVNIFRIARGIPTGADIDYADNATLSQALNRRITY